MVKGRVGMIFLLISFLGYVVGRLSHMSTVFFNPNSPHHWIYGAILTILGIIYWNESLAKYALFFGIGLFISDLKDFLGLKFIGPDEKGPKKFWGID